MRLSKFLYTKTNIFIAVLLTVVMGLYAWLAMGSAGDCISLNQTEKIKVLGLNFGYTSQTVLNLFQSLNLEGLKCYSEMLKIWDSVFPFIYGSMYLVWLSLIYKNVHFNNPKLKLINLYPIIPLIADLTENYFEYSLLSEYLLNHTVTEKMVQITSLISQIKWVFSSVNYLIIITGIILLLYQKRKKTLSDK